MIEKIKALLLAGILGALLVIALRPQRPLGRTVDDDDDGFDPCTQTVAHAIP